MIWFNNIYYKDWRSKIVVWTDFWKAYVNPLSPSVPFLCFENVAADPKRKIHVKINDEVTEVFMNKNIREWLPAQTVAYTSVHECCCDSVLREPRYAEFPRCLPQSRPFELRQPALAVQQNLSVTIKHSYTATSCLNTTFHSCFKEQQGVIKSDDIIHKTIININQ